MWWSFLQCSTVTKRKGYMWSVMSKALTQHAALQGAL